MEEENSAEKAGACAAMEEGPPDEGPSQEISPEEQAMIDKSKGELTNAIKYVESILYRLNMLTNSPPSEISATSMAMGEAIADKIIDMVADRKIIHVDEVIAEHEIDELQLYNASKGAEGDDDDFNAEEFASAPADYIPLSYKERTVALATAHPKWSLKTLQANGCGRLKHKQHLYRWKNDVKKGGTHFDKWYTIDCETYERFLDARRNLEQVTTRTLQQWAMNSAFPFLSDSFQFNASSTWVERFKKHHKIRQRKITKFISSKEFATMDEVLAAAEEFQIHTKISISNFDLDFVINTDQTGCQYQSTYNRSLAEQGSKTVLVRKKDLNKISHSFTAQYALTASGKIFPFVFLVMQEPSGKFGPIVRKKVNDLTNKFKNVIVACSKSGKFTKQLYEEFLKSCVLPYVRQEKFLFIIDSWGGQTDQTLYDHTFKDERGASTCTVKVIPPKCTPVCQPCDVYFYRQVKNFTKRLQNAPELLKNKREIASREDSIRIHSLILHQFRAPAFSPMIKYAWFASKLIEERTIFSNLNELCFPLSLLKSPCACKQVAFVKCAWCCTVLCFSCFYDKYHPKFCSANELEEASTDSD